MFKPTTLSNSSAERLFSPRLLWHIVENSNTLLFVLRITVHEQKMTSLVDSSHRNPCHRGWVRRRGLEYRSCFCSQSSGANPKFLTYNCTELQWRRLSWSLLWWPQLLWFVCFMLLGYCIQSKVARWASKNFTTRCTVYGCDSETRCSGNARKYLSWSKLCMDS